MTLKRYVADRCGRVCHLFKPGASYKLKQCMRQLPRADRHVHATWLGRLCDIFEHEKACHSSVQGC